MSDLDRTITDSAKGLYSDKSVYSRRILVSYKRVGFQQKVSLYKRGDSTYTIYHYSLLAFGKFCSETLGNVGALSIL
jgi:hypothetical protein